MLQIPAFNGILQPSLADLARFPAIRDGCGSPVRGPGRMVETCQARRRNHLVPAPLSCAI